MRRRLLFALLLVGSAACKPRQTTEVRVAAASDLRQALPEVLQTSPSPAGAVFGASGVLAAQIRAGGPFDVFASADAQLVDRLVADGLALGDTRRIYARGSLVVWAKAAPAPRLDELGDARFKVVAIANPAVAPYGRAAEAALRKLDLWDRLGPRLVRGENVEDAFRLASSGNADVVIVSATTVRGRGGDATPVDPSLHPPITQAVVVLTGARDVPRARAFVDHLTSAKGVAILTRYGLAPP